MLRQTTSQQRFLTSVREGEPQDIISYLTVYSICAQLTYGEIAEMTIVLYFLSIIQYSLQYESLVALLMYHLERPQVDLCIPFYLTSTTADVKFVDDLASI